MTTETVKQLVTTVSALPGAREEPAMMISTTAPDRDGDRVIPEGADLSNFRRNSPLMWSHELRSLPIGTVTAVEVMPRVGVRARWRWLEGDEFASRVKNAWEQGVMRAASIGFLPRRSRPNDFGGRDITEWELLEVSLVTVPANPEAVRALKAFGLLDLPARRPSTVIHLNRGDIRDAVKDALAEWIRQVAAAHVARLKGRVD